MSVHASQMRLVRATKDLRAQWQRVNQVWNDSASRTFAERLFPPIEAEIRRGVSTMAEMDQLLQRVKRDCSDSR